MGQNLNGTIRQGGQTLTGVLGSPSRSLSASVRVVGRGIADIDIDDDGYMTVTYTDGTTWVSDESLIGPQGDPGSTGPAGTGISSVSVDADGYITVTYTNGQSQTMTTSVKGPQGPSGQNGTSAGFGTPTATIDANTGTPSVTVSATGPDTAKVFAFDFKNLKGQAGQNGTNGTNGAAAGFGTVSATVDANTGTPSVEVTSSGPDTAKQFAFAFHNLKGQSGSGSGTVTQVSTGVGLTGGPVTSSGTIKANLKSETASSRASENISSTQGRQYAVNLDSNSKLSVNVPWENTTYESKSASSGGTAVSLCTTGEKYTWNNKSDFSGNYSDLSGKPTLATVATTGDYDDLTDKPTIPTVPTNVSAFTNDAGYLTSHQSIKTINSTSMTGTGNVTVQPTLVSGTNIKTVNSTSLLGSGNVAVQPTLISGTNIKTVNSTSLLGSGDVAVQPTLVSGTNIKTVNNESLLGSGNITIQGGSGADVTQVSITVANWNATTTCTKTVTGVTTSNSVIVSPAPASIADYVSAGVYCSAQGSGTLTFTASSTPTADLVVNVMVVG